jgi:two-component system phosphate regulon response regulator OmpR
MNNVGKHILVVDDDKGIRTLLKEYLEKEKFLVSIAKDADEARSHIKDFVFDLIILDVMMPKESGIDFADKLKEQKLKTPILMLTALGEVNDRIKGLEAGVDDYLSKPFDPKELLLRINNILKRVYAKDEKEENGELNFGSFTYNKESAKLMKGNEIINLTTSENDLLKLFINHEGEILTRDEIGKYLNYNDNFRSIDVQITRLRKKIEENPKTPRFLRTIRNKGYQFTAD